MAAGRAGPSPCDSDWTCQTELPTHLTWVHGVSTANIEAPRGSAMPPGSPVGAGREGRSPQGLPPLLSRLFQPCPEGDGDDGDGATQSRTTHRGGFTPSDT